MIAKTVRDYLILTLACFIFAWAWEGFMIPNDMSAGGMMGLCTVIQYATGGVVQAQYSYLSINVLLIILAVLSMGIGFGFRSIYCILVSTLAMGLLSSVDFLKSMPGEFFFVQETLLIPVIAGLLEAFGLGLVLRFGGSTGGTDIIALMVHKYWPISLSAIFLISDLLVVALLLLLPDKQFSDMCYGIVELVTFSMMVDTVVGGQRNSYQLMVFSKKYETIADHITQVLGRGLTVLDGQGWFTKQNRRILLVLINKKELPGLSKLIKETDPEAFMSVSRVGNVYGEGFEEIKTGFKINKKKNESEA